MALIRFSGPPIVRKRKGYMERFATFKLCTSSRTVEDENGRMTFAV